MLGWQKNAQHLKQMGNNNHSPAGHKGNKRMTPSQQAKSLGHRTLADVARITEIKADTLRKYHSTKPVLFKVICLGALQIKGESNEETN